MPLKNFFCLEFESQAQKCTIYSKFALFLKKRIESFYMVYIVVVYRRQQK